MGTFKVRIEIGDPKGERWEQVTALVGTRATFALAPRSLLERLHVQAFDRATFRLPDSSAVQEDIGQTWFRIGDRSEIGIVVFGREDEPALVGMNTLEGLLLQPDPENERLIPKLGLMLSNA